MNIDSTSEWLSVLKSAADAIGVADPTDLRPLQRGVDLACDAAAAATSEDLAAAMRWMAVSEQVTAVAHDLARIPDLARGQVLVGPPSAMPNTPAVQAELRRLWREIHAGLYRYMDGQSDGARVFCAAITARSALRLIEAGTS